MKNHQSHGSPLLGEDGTRADHRRASVCRILNIDNPKKNPEHGEPQPDRSLAERCKNPQAPETTSGTNLAQPVPGSFRTPLSVSPTLVRSNFPFQLLTLAIGIPFILAWLALIGPFYLAGCVMDARR